MLHYLIGTAIGRLEPLELKALNQWFRDRRSRTLHKGSGQTFDLIETPDSLGQVHEQLDRLLRAGHSPDAISRWVCVPIAEDQVPADAVNGLAWVRARGDLGPWTSSLQPML